MAEITAMRNNALPYPVYAAPWTIVFPMLDADGDLVTGASTPDAEISKNGDTFADCTNESTEIATNSGMYYLALTGAEMTADIVAVIAKSATSGMKTTPLVLYPRKLVQLAAGTSQGGSAGYITLAAGTVLFDNQFDGCLCVATIDGNVEARVLHACTASNQQCTVTPEWNVQPDADDTYIIFLPEGRRMPTVNVKALSDDITASDNCELMFDGTGYAGGTAKLQVDLTKILGTALSETGAGYLAAAFVKLFDVSSPVLTSTSVNQTGDAYGKVNDGTSGNAALKTLIDTLTGYVDTEVAAIKAKTDNLPASPANETTLTTIAGYLDTEIAAILADTNELQTDLANGGRLDLLIDAIKAKTDGLNFTGSYVQSQVKGQDDIDFGATQKASITTAVPTTAQIKTAIEAEGSHLALILEDTGTTLDALIDAIKAKTDNLPEGIKKNTSLNNFEFLMVLSSDHVTGAAGKTITATRSIDGGAFGACTNSASEVANGIYKINLAAADLNGDIITLKFTAADCDARIITIKTGA